MVEPLRLKAVDADDLDVLSSCLQDAVVPLSEILFQPEEARFVMVATRFRWEDAGEAHLSGRIYERVRCGVRFDRVKAVRVLNVDQNNRGQMLSLLAIQPADGQIDLIFGGGGVIRLEIEGIVCHVDDFDEPWPTQWRPSHPQAE